MSPSRPHTELLERQLRHRYRALDRTLRAGVGPAQSQFQLGSRPTIAWHTQHVGAAIESTREALFGTPPGHGGDRPWPADWEALRDAVLDAGGDLSDRLAGTTDEQLSAAPLVDILPAFRSSLGTRQSFLEGHIYHVTYHLGSMAVLRAELGLE